MKAPRRIFLFFVLAGFLGCQRGPTKTDLAPEEKHILKVVSLYTDFRAKNARAPSSLDELKAFAKKMSQQDLAARGIDDLDQAFISPRDQQPYVLVKPVAQTMMKGGPPNMQMVLLYEKTGVDGKRMVASGMGGGAFEWDEAKLKEYIPNP
jgi:hypothetical protein